jgi:hypothetical protein
MVGTLKNASSQVRELWLVSGLAQSMYLTELPSKQVRLCSQTFSRIVLFSTYNDRHVTLSTAEEPG